MDAHFEEEIPGSLDGRQIFVVTRLFKEPN